MTVNSFCSSIFVFVSDQNLKFLKFKFPLSCIAFGLEKFEIFMFDYSHLLISPVRILTFP